MFNKFTNVMCVYFYSFIMYHIFVEHRLRFTVFIICIIATHDLQVKYYLVNHFSNSVMERSVLYSLPFKLYCNFFQLSFSSLWSFQIDIWKTTSSFLFKYSLINFVNTDYLIPSSTSSDLSLSNLFFLMLVSFKQH